MRIREEQSSLIHGAQPRLLVPALNCLFRCLHHLKPGPASIAHYQHFTLQIFQIWIDSPGPGEVPTELSSL